MGKDRNRDRQEGGGEKKSKKSGREKRDGEAARNKYN
jgi:hypothetical protein